MVEVIARVMVREREQVRAHTKSVERLPVIYRVINIRCGASIIMLDERVWSRVVC